MDASSIGERTSTYQLTPLMEKKMSDRPLMIVINGESIEWISPTISYEDVLVQVGARPGMILSMVFKAKNKGDHRYEGMLTPGKVIDVSDGLIINAVDTGNA